jgi:hypothetical protein
MSGQELVDFLRRLSARALREPVVIGDGDPEGEGFVLAAPRISGPVWVQGHGKREVLVMARDPHPVLPATPPHAPRRARRPRREARIAAVDAGEPCLPSVPQAACADGGEAPQRIGEWQVRGLVPARVLGGVADVRAGHESALRPIVARLPGLAASDAGRPCAAAAVAVDTAGITGTICPALNLASTAGGHLSSVTP